MAVQVGEKLLPKEEEEERKAKSAKEKDKALASEIAEIAKAGLRLPSMPEIVAAAVGNYYSVDADDGLRDAQRIASREMYDRWLEGLSRGSQQQVRG